MNKYCYQCTLDEEAAEVDNFGNGGESGIGEKLPVASYIMAVPIVTKHCFPCPCYCSIRLRNVPYNKNWVVIKIHIIRPFLDNLYPPEDDKERETAENAVAEAQASFNKDKKEEKDMESVSSQHSNESNIKATSNKDPSIQPLPKSTRAPSSQPPSKTDRAPSSQPPSKTDRAPSSQPPPKSDTAPSSQPPPKSDIAPSQHPSKSTRAPSSQPSSKSDVAPAPQNDDSQIADPNNKRLSQTDNPKNDDPQIDLNPKIDDPQIDLNPLIDDSQIDLNPKNDDSQIDLNPENDDPQIDTNPENNEEIRIEKEDDPRRTSSINENNDSNRQYRQSNDSNGQHRQFNHSYRNFTESVNSPGQHSNNYLAMYTHNNFSSNHPSTKFITNFLDQGQSSNFTKYFSKTSTQNIIKNSSKLIPQHHSQNYSHNNNIDNPDCQPQAFIEAENSTDAARARSKVGINFTKLFPPCVFSTREYGRPMRDIYGLAGLDGKKMIIAGGLQEHKKLISGGKYGVRICVENKCCDPCCDPCCNIKRKN